MIAVTLIVGAQLWERAGNPRVRKRVAPFDPATTARVVIGLLALHRSLFVLARR